MKKIIIGLLLLVCCCCGLSGDINSAYAGEPATKQYLINTKYSSNANDYGILDEEVKSISRPFDESIKYMKEGQSVAPLADSYNRFDKTINTNVVNINGDSSLYVYVFFSEITAHDLTITLSNASASLTWTISGATLDDQIVIETTSYDIRYGWMLLELPFSVATQNGNLNSVETLNVKYWGDNSQCAKLIFYAPFISEKQHNTISFLDKQNYFNYSVKYNFNLSSIYVGDELKISSLSNIFEYCIIGDIDCLSIGIPQDYKLVFSVVDSSGTVIKSFNLKNEMPISYKFEQIDAYLLRLVVFSNDNQALWKNPDITVNVDEFIAAYLPYGIADIKVDSFAQFDILNGSFTGQIYSINAESLNTKVAEAYVENEKLIVKGKKAGKTTIKLIISAARNGQAPQVYEYEYSVKVLDSSTTSVIGLIFGGIGLLIGGIIVYNIMVRRRLIAGKYPKY